MKRTPYVCRPEAPWKPEYGTPAQHTNAREVGDQDNGWPGGDIVTMEVPRLRHALAR